MRRTKAWWAKLDRWERSDLVGMERADSSGYGAGGWIPDDCCECGWCSTPHLGSGLCSLCLNELMRIIQKANAAMGVSA